jgi:ABC-type nitrate/sulfonate/bicarbonate transport system substrate-binding protein
MGDLVKQARDLLDGVTGERWCFEEYQNGLGQTGIQVVAQDGTVICDDEPFYPQAVERKNARFIAATRDLVPAMADRIEALEAALRKADDHLTNLQPHIPQACYPGRRGFIDAHVDAAVLVIRAALEGK